MYLSVFKNPNDSDRRLAFPMIINKPQGQSLRVYGLNLENLYFSLLSIVI